MEEKMFNAHMEVTVTALVKQLEEDMAYLTDTPHHGASLEEVRTETKKQQELGGCCGGHEEVVLPHGFFNLFFTP